MDTTLFLFVKLIITYNNLGHHTGQVWNQDFFSGNCDGDILGPLCRCGIQNYPDDLLFPHVFLCHHSGLKNKTFSNQDSSVYHRSNENYDFSFLNILNILVLRAIPFLSIQVWNPGFFFFPLLIFLDILDSLFLLANLFLLTYVSNPGFFFFPLPHTCGLIVLDDSWTSCYDSHIVQQWIPDCSSSGVD